MDRDSDPSKEFAFLGLSARKFGLRLLSEVGPRNTWTSGGTQAGAKAYQRVNGVGGEIQGLMVNHSAIVLFDQSESVIFADHWLITCHRL